MTPDDLAALHARCFTTPRPWTAAEFAALLGGPGIRLCAGADSFALGRTIAGEAELLTLAVAPNARRRGLGRARLTEFETAARAGGATTAVLEVAADNGPARALYAAAGYVRAGLRRGYYTDPKGRVIDALVLRKSLGG